MRIPVSNLLAGFVAASALLGGVVYVIEGAAAALDQATARQCAARDWPADKAVATEAWCRDNDYFVPPLHTAAR